MNSYNKINCSASINHHQISKQHADYCCQHSAVDGFYLLFVYLEQKFKQKIIVKWGKKILNIWVKSNYSP